jgi:hypothetical protein
MQHTASTTQSIRRIDAKPTSIRSSIIIKLRKTRIRRSLTVGFFAAPPRVLRSHRPADEHNQIAPFHGQMPSALPPKDITLVRQGRCVAGFQSNLCRRWVDAVEKASAKELWS